MIDDYDIISGHKHGLYDVPEHEVLMSFNNDNDAVAFIEWFNENREKFEEYFGKYFDI